MHICRKQYFMIREGKKHIIMLQFWKEKKAILSKPEIYLNLLLFYTQPQTAPVLQEEEISIWKTGYELAFVLFQLKAYKQSFDLINKLIEDNLVPDVESKFLLSLKDKIQKGFLEKS